MKRGEKFTQTVSGIKLKKGKYEALVQVSPFSVGSSQLSLSTVPIVFEVK